MKYTFNQQQANISKESVFPNKGPYPKHIDVSRKKIHAPQKLKLRNLSKADLNPLYSWKPQKTKTGPIFWFGAGHLPITGAVLLVTWPREAQHCAAGGLGGWATPWHLAGLRRQLAPAPSHLWLWHCLLTPTASASSSHLRAPSLKL